MKIFHKPHLKVNGNIYGRKHFVHHKENMLKTTVTIKVKPLLSLEQYTAVSPKTISVAFKFFYLSKYNIVKDQAGKEIVIVMSLKIVFCKHQSNMRILQV